MDLVHCVSYCCSRIQFQMISLETILRENSKASDTYFSGVDDELENINVTFVGLDSKTISVEQSHQFDSEVYSSTLIETEYKDGLNYSSFCIEPVPMIEKSEGYIRKAYVFYIDNHEVYTIVNHSTKIVTVIVKYKSSENILDTDVGNFYNAIAECNKSNYYYTISLVNISKNPEKVLNALSSITFSKGVFHHFSSLETITSLSTFENLSSVAVSTKTLDKRIFDKFGGFQNLKQLYIYRKYNGHYGFELDNLKEFLPELFERNINVTLADNRYEISLKFLPEGKVCELMITEYSMLDKGIMSDIFLLFMEVADHIDIVILLINEQIGFFDDRESIYDGTLNKLRSIKYIFDKTDMYDLSINYSNRSSAKSAASVCQ